MQHRPGQRRPRRDETLKFRQAIVLGRQSLGWSQARLALVLGISKRTLSHWENGYWLPPFKQRIHLVVALDVLPSKHVLAIADGLGVSVNPVLTPLLQRHRDAVENEDDEGALSEVAVGPASDHAPAKAPEGIEQLRAAIDAIVREAADPINVTANDLRAALGRVLAECANVGASLEEARAAVAVRRTVRRDGG